MVYSGAYAVVLVLQLLAVAAPVGPAGALAAGSDAGSLERRAALGAAVAVPAWSAVVVLMVVKPGA